jgi:two-component SAPR family response regulator
MPIDVLIVDDNDGINLIRTRLNSEFDCDASICDVAGAMDYLSHTKPYIAVVEPEDENQPLFQPNDRTQFIKEIKQQGITVVLATCVEKKELDRYGLEPNDYDYYIGKPYKTEDLVDVIRAV